MTLDERQDRLKPIVDAYRHIPFVWAMHDCCLFVARCVDAQLGTRFEERAHRDFDYHEAVSAIRAVKAAGGWEPLISRYFGPSVPPGQLELGDVVLGRAKAPFERTSLLGICDEEVFMAPDTAGIAWHPMENALMGWKLMSIPWRM